jgi:hypothetical protein
MSSKKPIVNKIFLECAKIIEDPFWVEKFNYAAMGKFPTNFYYYDNTLIYGINNNKIVLPSNIQDVVIVFINFFEQHEIL